MLGIDRKTASITWTAALVLALLWLLVHVRVTVFVFILAVLFAYLLSPLVNLLDRFLPTRGRTAALTLSYLLFVSVLGVAGYQIGSRAAEQANTLVKELPARIEAWKVKRPGATGVFEKYRVEIVDKVQSEVAARSNDIIKMIPEAGGKFLSVASGLLHVIIIPILAFFLLKEGRAIRTYLLGIVEDGPRRTLLDDILVDVDVLLAQYMRALVALSAATLIAYGAFFAIMGVPYSILLAALAALLEFIPMIGPLTAGVVIMVVALASDSHPIAVLAFLLIYRLFQDYVLTPHLMGRGVELHPVLVLFGVFAGTEVAGIAGAFLSVPVLALCRILYIRILKTRAARDAVSSAAQ